MLDYRLVEAFAAVIEEKGFEKAGLRLGLTQSAVSQRIRALEEQTGTILVIRDTPPRPSPGGERLLGLYRQVRDLEQAALDSIGAARISGFTNLAIAINADSLATWFLDALLPFLDSRQITLDIRVDDQEQTLHYLKAGVVCACLSAQAASVTGCQSQLLGSMEYRLCSSPVYRERWLVAGFTKEAARSAPVIHFNRDDRLQLQALERCFGAGNMAPPAHYIPSTERIFPAVLAGLGYCMIPLVQAAPALAAGTLVELHPAARTAVQLWWHRWSLAPPGLLDLSRELEAQAARMLTNTRPGD